MSGLQAWLSREHQLVGQFRSRTSTLLRYRSEESPQTILLKVSPAWDRGQAESAYGTMGRCRAFSEENAIPHFVPKPLWWGSSPSFIGMHWVEGTRLTDHLVANYEAGKSDLSPEVRRTLVALGRVLATFHASFRTATDWERTDVDSTIRDLGRRSTKLVEFLTSCSLVEWPFLVTTLGDIRTNNVLVDDSGDVWLLDTPVEWQLTPAESDLARLCVRSRLAIARAQDMPVSASRLASDEVCHLIVDGYGEARRALGGGDEPLASLDPFLAAEGWKRGRKAIQQNRFSEALGELYLGAAYALRALGDRGRT